GIGIGTAIRIGRTGLWHCLNHVRIGNAATSGSTVGAATTILTSATAATKSTAAASLHLKQWRLVEVNRQSFIVTVSNRTLSIRESRVVDRPTRLQSLRLLNRDAVRDAVIDWHLRDTGNCYEQAACFNELL